MTDENICMSENKYRILFQNVNYYVHTNTLVIHNAMVCIVNSLSSRGTHRHVGVGWHPAEALEPLALRGRRGGRSPRDLHADGRWDRIRDGGHATTVRRRLEPFDLLPVPSLMMPSLL